MGYRPRIIPSLLLSGKGIVKTKSFKDPVYIGDPINTVKIFNDNLADEILLLDIDATIKNQSIQFDLVKRIAEEAYMPLSYGGGVQTIETARKLIQSGVEKIVLGAAAFFKPSLIADLSNEFGSQALTVCVDVKDDLTICVNNGQTRLNIDLFAYLEQCEKNGAGEIMVQFIDKEGTLLGLNFDLIKRISSYSSLPIIISGGTKSLDEIKKATLIYGASAVAVGALFTFMGTRNSVLINYPDQEELDEIFE